MSAEQLAALEVLKLASRMATDCGLFDILVADCKDPDSVNDVCDAIFGVSPRPRPAGADTPLYAGTVAQ